MAKKLKITERLCETKPAKRVKVYDDRCPGFYVSVTPAGVATFNFKFTNRVSGKRDTIKIGDYDPVHLTIAEARSQAFDLKGRVGVGEDIAANARRAKTQQAKLSGKTVGDLITEYTAWMKELVKKDDGEMRPRIESWDGAAGYLERFARPALGAMVASEVENDHVAELQAKIVKGTANKNYKASLSSARNTRTAMSAMFGWAAEAGRKYVKHNPCHDLPSLDKEPTRERVLSAAEIKTLWWGLDDPELPCARSIALALKFELATMLRSKEFLSGKRSELTAMDTENAQLKVPLKRVKKRRVIVQPLSDLAQEVVREAMKVKADGGFIFVGKYPDEPLSEKALSQAVNGKMHNGKLVRKGIRQFLGMQHWTPHDLRRTSSTLAGDLGFSDASIGRCLDHRGDKDEAGEKIASVTGVYVRSKRMKEKREVIDAVGAELRRIIGDKPATKTRAKAVVAA